ncbi:hypothetical protein ACE6H2_026059 [Prunus campanulata]
MVEFKYEYLPYYYFTCGSRVHPTQAIPTSGVNLLASWLADPQLFPCLLGDLPQLARVTKVVLRLGHGGLTLMITMSLWIMPPPNLSRSLRGMAANESLCC